MRVKTPVTEKILETVSIDVDEIRIVSIRINVLKKTVSIQYQYGASVEERMRWHPVKVLTIRRDQWESFWGDLDQKLQDRIFAAGKEAGIIPATAR